ncbi:MAG: PKD domain-containing protein [Methanoregula sp.]|nr:PKD domain-containing protein [Methanoregula sp.]
MHKIFPGVIILLLLVSTILILPVPAAPTQTLITTGNGAAESPSIFGDQIVWQDYRNGNAEIYLYNLTTGTETQITSDPWDHMSPRISGDLIVWEDYSDPFFPSVYLYNITTQGPILQVSDGMSSQMSPAISGNRIVWVDDRSGFSNIFINDTTPGLETPLSEKTVTQYVPAIHDDLVVWAEAPTITDENIFLFNLNTLSASQITTDPNLQTNPAVFGSRIVWDDNRNGKGEVFINGTVPGEEYSLTPNQPAIEHRNPVIFGTRVVWSQENSTDGGWDLALNDTATGILSPIAVEPVSSKQHPHIYVDPDYGDRIVWQDDRSGYHQIYLYSSTGPGTCPVAAFTSDFAGGGAPADVQFTDLTPTGSTHWNWDFGDGATSTDQNPNHTYTDNNPYTVTLTVSNPWCRNATTVPDYIVLGAPVASFTAMPTSEIVPATIQFNDTSDGSPDTWSWDFGDGGVSPQQHPTHVYTVPGIYTVSLTASNTFGDNTSTRLDYIHALKGANAYANTSIDGVSLSSCGQGPQTITVDTSIVTATLTNSSVLELLPPADRGFAKVIVYAFDGNGFTTASPIISGNVTGTHLQTSEIAPAGFSPETGPVSVSYSVDLSSYPCNATLNTRVWEGTTFEDRRLFERIALGSSFAHWLGTPYTTRISKTNFPAGETAQFHMSANATWVAIKEGRDGIYIEHIFEDRTLGEVLPTRYLSHDPVLNLDYFEADSPHGLSTFGLSALSGSGNPLQLVTLTIASHVSPENLDTARDTSSDDSGVRTLVPTPAPTMPVSTTPAPNMTAPLTPLPPDPGASAKIYTNANGVVTQATRLQSTDGHALLTIGEGIVAKDSGGKPLSIITIRAIPSSSLPAVPAGSVFTFAGMAYDVGPDGATFSPPASLSFSLPQAQWGQDYSVKSFDQKSGTWQDVPTSFDAATGMVTAHFSHLCVFALFTEPHTSPVTTPAATPPPVPATPLVKAQPPTTAVSIFMNMIAQLPDLLMNNAVVLAIVALLGIAAYIVRQGKFPG